MELGRMHSPEEIQRRFKERILKYIYTCLGILAVYGFLGWRYWEPIQGFIKSVGGTRRGRHDVQFWALLLLALPFYFLARKILLCPACGKEPGIFFGKRYCKSCGAALLGKIARMGAVSVSSFAPPTETIRALRLAFAAEGKAAKRRLWLIMPAVQIVIFAMVFLRLPGPILAVVFAVSMLALLAVVIKGAVRFKKTFAKYKDAFQCPSCRAPLVDDQATMRFGNTDWLEEQLARLSSEDAFCPKCGFAVAKYFEPAVPAK